MLDALFEIILLLIISEKPISLILKPSLFALIISSLSMDLIPSI